MRTSTISLRLICQALYREITVSWKRIFFLIATLLVVYLFVVFDFVSSTLGSGADHRWNWVYDRLLNVPEHVRQTIDIGTPSTTSVPDQSFDVNVIRKRSNDTLHCANHRIGIPLEGVDTLLEESFAWHRVSGRFYETYVFSAYYDNRLSSARVVIVGISDEYVLRETVSLGREFCQIWYPGDDDEFDVVEAEFSFVPEHHDLRWASYIFSGCPI